MNKIKLLYDVITKMKNKEVINGTITAEGKKDNLNIFSFENEFEKNTLTGHIKTKISTEMDYEGKRIKHESSTDFNMPDCHGNMHHRFIKHHHNHDEDHTGMKFGPKDGLNRIAFALSILNALKADELEDKSYMLSLSLNEMPEDIKQAIHEKMNSEKSSEKHGLHDHFFMKEFHSMNSLNIDLNIYINKDFEIEKIMFNAKGEQRDELSVEHEMSTKVDLSLTW
jgi:hypothetical protein